MALDGRFGAPATADQAWPLAVELAALMDEAERAEIDLATVLPRLVAEDYAEHWGITLDFLAHRHARLAGLAGGEGADEPGGPPGELLDAQAEAWRTAPPDTRVLAAGSTGGIPAVARLLRVVAGLPQGQVVLPGLDLDLAEAAWDGLEDSHPQAGLRRLLSRLDARRGDVRPVRRRARCRLRAPTLLHRALLPAHALEAWRDTAPIEPSGLFRLPPPTSRRRRWPSRSSCAARWSAGPPCRAGHAGSGPGGPGGGGAGPVRHRRRRQRRRAAGRNAARGVPAAAGRGGGGCIASRAAAGLAEASAGGGRADPGGVPRRPGGWSGRGCAARRRRRAWPDCAARRNPTGCGLRGRDGGVPGAVAGAGRTRRGAPADAWRR